MQSIIIVEEILGAIPAFHCNLFSVKKPQKGFSLQSGLVHYRSIDIWKQKIRSNHETDSQLFYK
ncbi:MAG TPA: hypothetical protein VK623_08795 [Flavobacterium sp.]|nr:hypothetical protein [Flavobacterium sp.]